jgi:protein disulfide-isomerase A6
MAKGKAHMIDCDLHKEIAQKYDIKGFPTIRYYPNGPKNGNPREYQGNRTAKDIMDFMQ